jgi:hypothetical protein
MITTITTRTLLAPTSTKEEAELLAKAARCSGYYLVIPPSMLDNVEEGDTFPLVIEEEYLQEEG